MIWLRYYSCLILALHLKTYINNEILLASVKDGNLHISANSNNVYDYEYELGQTYNIIIQYSGMQNMNY